ncbi:MAG: tRNA (adenosine(37)-N6)-threonylcarbamoyltransferase complex dimerization subunit type 1 TsaB [Rubrobacteraceae bacterium]
MLILAFDASTPVVSVAVARQEDDEREVLTEVVVTSRGASEALLPAAHAALDFAGEGLEDVERILVGVGPGTFTGIRIAASTARALSLGAGTALSGNSTLAALSAPALAGGHPDVLAVLDAKRGEVFAQRYTGEESGNIFCAGPGELRFEGSPLLIGDGAIRYREVLSGTGHIPPDGSPVHRVTATGHVLSADLAPVAAGDLVPIYVREPDAEVRKDLNPWSR